MRPLAPNSQYDHRAAMTRWHLRDMLSPDTVPESLDAPEILPSGSVKLRSAGSTGTEWFFLSVLGVAR